MEKLTRRRFLRWGGVVAAGAGVALAVPEGQITEKRANLEWMAHPDDYQFQVRGKADNRGSVKANLALLWKKSEDEMEEVVKHLDGVAEGGRTFINYLFSHGIDQFNDNVLEKIILLGEVLNRHNKKLYVDLEDANDFRWIVNLTYGFARPRTPYSVKGEYGFYVDKNLQEAQIRKYKYIAAKLAKVKNLAGVSIANESGPPFWHADGKQVYEKWLRRMAGAVREQFPDQTIYSGCADPRDTPRVPGIDVYTIHCYPGKIWDGLREHITRNGKDRYEIQEIGVEKRIAGVKINNFDERWRSFLIEALDNICEVDEVNKIVTLPEGIGPWQLERLRVDGYEMILEEMLRTNKDLRLLNQILKGEIGVRSKDVL